VNDIETLLVSLFDSHFGIPTEGVDRDTTFDELGIDSLIIVELALLLRKRLGIALADWELTPENTLGEAAELLAAKRAAAS
jgi:acyl carrier protein